MIIIYTLVLSLIPLTLSNPNNRLNHEPTRKSYIGYKVYNVFPTNNAQIGLLEHLWLNDTTMMLDFWRPPGRHRRRVDVMVPPASVEGFERLMRVYNFTSTVMMPDVADAIAKESEAVKFNSIFLRDEVSKGVAVDGFRLDRYHTYEEIQQWLRRLVHRYPDAVQLISLQNETSRQSMLTHEGRVIDMVKVGIRRPDGSRKPGFWIDGGIHAREWAAPTVILYIINQLLQGLDGDKKMLQYLESIDWYLLPVANPDGYEHSRNFDRMWRKNRNPNSYNRFSWCWGVDLNRNFDWNWGGRGASHDECKETFHGQRAFSEPETKAIAYQVRKIRSSLEGFITLHSYSQIWMYPFGHDYNKKPSDWKDLMRVARKAASTLRSYYGKQFEVDTGANALYPASGGSDDWAKGKMNIKYVYLVELRPEDESQVSAIGRQSHFGFLLPESQIIPTGQETWGGVQVVADAILKRNNVQPYTSAPCVDAVPDRCPLWASHGKCITFKNYMRRKCRKSCDMCPM